MADLSILAGATSQSILVDLYILSTGAGQTGLVYNSTGLTAYYSFAGANATSTAIVLATLSLVTSAYSSGGFKELDATNMPGVYRFDVPTAVLAASKGREVIVTFNGYSGMAQRHIKIELTGWDNQNATNGGISALPATSCTSNASLITEGTGTAQLTTSSGAVLLQATQTGVTIPTVTTVTNQLSAAAIATGVWQDSTSGDFTVSSSIGKSLYTSGNAPGAASGIALVGSNVGAASSVTGAVGSVTGNVGGNVTGSVGSVVAAVAITSNRKKGSTATFEFLMQNSSTGAPQTGLTVASTISKDGGASASTANSVTEIGLGQYQIVLTGTEMTANNIFLQFTSSGATTANLSIQTAP